MITKHLNQHVSEDNLRLLKFIIDFLNQVEKKHPVNKMTASNLAIIWGILLIRPELVPDLLISPRVQSLNEGIAFAAKGSQFIEFLMNHPDNIFLPV